VWDGVRNPVALKHLRSMRKGDEVLIYHTGKERAAVGLARIAAGPYPDPGASDERLVVVEVAAGKRLRRPVTLADIKADGAFADLALVRQGRLSVVPVQAVQWKRLLAMGGSGA
jgi:predicted RNA-binding protein with PUA-like domain